MDDTTRLRRKVLRTRLGIAALVVPIIILTGFGFAVDIANHFHGRYIVTLGSKWCALRPGVVSPQSAVAAMNSPTATGKDSTSGQYWSEWKFRDVDYEITWFPGNERGQDLWASVTSQWGRLPCGHERIEYSGWYQPTQPWQEPPDPGAFQ